MKARYEMGDLIFCIEKNVKHIYDDIYEHYSKSMEEGKISIIF